MVYTLTPAVRQLLKMQSPLIVDTVSRADSTTGIGTTDTGQVWKTLSGGPLAISGGKMKWGGTGSAGKAVVPFSQRDVEVAMVIRSPTSNFQRIMIGAKDSANQMLCVFQVGGLCRLYNVSTAGGSVQIAASQGNIAIADGDTLALSRIDNVFRARVNNLDMNFEVLDATYSDYLTYGWSLTTTAPGISRFSVTPLGFGTAVQKTFDSNFAVAGFSNYTSVKRAECGTIVDDPILGSARKVAKAVVPNTAIGVTANPRWQASSSNQMIADDEGYIGFAVMFPSDLPTIPHGNSGFMNTNQIYGPDYTGSTPFHLGFTSQDDANYVWRGGDDFPANTVIWSMGVPPKAIWIDHRIHFKMSNDPTIGFIEIEINIGAGWVKQVFNDVSGWIFNSDHTRIYLATQSATANIKGPNHHDIQIYRKVDMFDSITMWFANHRIAATAAAVDPHSYDWTV